MALLKIFQDNFTCQGLDTSFKFFTTITFAYIRKQIVLTFSTSTPMFEPKRSESYTKCWLFPQCNRLRHTNIHGNCKCLYVRSTHQSATHAVIKTHRQLSSILRFPPALACSFWAILRPTKGSSTYGSSESSSNLHCQIELSVSERLPCIDEILVKISKSAFHLCTIRQVRFLKLRHMTSHMSRSAERVRHINVDCKQS